MSCAVAFPVQCSSIQAVEQAVSVVSVALVLCTITESPVLSEVSLTSNGAWT